MTEQPVQFIRSWSHSKLMDFERCKLATKLKHLDRIPEPDRPLPPGKTEHANDRGTRIHTAAELYVMGKGPFIPEMKEFQPEFEKLQRLYKQGAVSLEGEWGMDRNWEIAPWNTAWHRCKIDALTFMSKTEAIVIDYKSGRKFGNEVKHDEQLRLYQLNAFLRFPELEVVHTELWYLDAKDLTSRVYTRDQGLRFKANFDKRGNAVTTNTAWPPNANNFSCRFCLYGPAHSGHCAVGVRKA